MKKTNKILLMSAFLAGTAIGAENLGYSRAGQPKQPVSASTISESKVDKSIMDEIDKWGKYSEKSECSKYTSGEFIDKMREKITYDKIKMNYIYADGISENDLKVMMFKKSAERIPDQLQRVINSVGTVVLFCDKHKKDTIYKQPIENSAGYCFQGYGYSLVLVSVPDANPHTLVHELGHVFDGTMRLDIIMKDPSSALYKIFEKYKDQMKEHYQSPEEHFAFMFQNYYGEDQERDGFKKTFPESYAFIQKLEALITERLSK